MQNQLLRGIVFIVLVFVVTSDVKELMSGLATSSSAFAPVLQWINPQLKISNTNEGDNHQSKSKALGDRGSREDIHPDPMIEAARRKLREDGGFKTSSITKNPNAKITEEEKIQLSALKQHLTSVMQQWCLPKLVCELHASITERGSLTDAERGLLSLIRETSLGTMGEVVSRYHFAAHMGQLLSGVEGNGCHNLYPNCPLSGNKVLQMVKKVRIR